MSLGFLRSGTPGDRLRRALAFSLVLHIGVLLPWSVLLSRQAPARTPPQPPLSATLALPPVLKTYTEEAEPPVRKPSPVLTPLPGPGRKAETTAKAEPPRELRGRALDKALAAMTREEFYPREAIARGLEGRVVLLLTLQENGVISGIEVASSSGHLLLDTAALKAAGRIGALPGGRPQVLLPVEFRLE